MTDDLVFEGRVMDINDSNDTFDVKCYDLISLLAREHIASHEGHYYGTDAGAIFKDVVYRSGNSVKIAGTVIGTGMIITEINLTDMSIVEAMNMLLDMINGELSESQTLYHYYVKNGVIILAPYPDHNGEGILDLVDSDIISLKRNIRGSEFYNCATVVGVNDIRGYYPCVLNDAGDMVPDFPKSPRHHKLITDYKDVLFGSASCYHVARGFVKTRKALRPEITIDIKPTRFDLTPGQPIKIDSDKFGISGIYRVMDMSWSYPKGSRMSMTLSDMKVDNLADLVKTITL